MSTHRNDDIEARVRQIGRALIESARERRQSFWTREHWEERLFGRIMADAALRTRLLQFVDVLPALPDDASIATHLEEYLGDDDLQIPELIKWGAEHAEGRVSSHVVAGVVRLALQTLARRFVGGNGPEEGYACLQHLRQRRLAASIDLLGETTLSDVEAERCAKRYLDVLTQLPDRLRAWPVEDLLDRVGSRPSPRLNLSIKVSALCAQFVPVASQELVEVMRERLRPILREARRQGASICFDMEQYALKDATLALFCSLGDEPEFRNWPDMGIALQAYLRDADADLQHLVDWATKRGTPITVRLVRGAYWDQEVVQSRQQGWTIPVWESKAATDACYERCVRKLMECHPHVEAAIGTHNVRSLAVAMAEAERRSLDRTQFELQMLYGMADPLKDSVAATGHRLRVYVPLGELIPGMAYLVRRLLENTSSQSFLRMSFTSDLPADELLCAPDDAPDEPLAAAVRVHGHTILPPFENEPVFQFCKGSERDAFADAIRIARSQLDQHYSLFIDGQPRETGELLESWNPAQPAECVGKVAEAGTAEVDSAVAAAQSAFLFWRATPVQERYAMLIRAAAALREHRAELAAWEILEAGKNWTEADADVCEAIDYLEYYAREAVRLDAEISLDVPGEYNRYRYMPRGVVAVIPPWNFPLAIPAGMLAAAVASGNTVVLKPAPQTPVIAARFVALLHAAGLPPGVVNFIAGRDDVIGNYLVQHPGVHVIAFTGSREVGLQILQRAAQPWAGQRYLKRVIAEMGGKNAIIIDSDADMDDAVSGTVNSVFGYAGQKCSAASRVIVVGGIAESFIARLIEAVRSLRIGMPEQSDTFMGPVIDSVARERIESTIAAVGPSAQLLYRGSLPALNGGHFVAPAVFLERDAQSALAQEEIFGPVLIVLRARTFEEALAMANDTPYALTGGVYSRLPSHLERARQEFQVGNLYLNRQITGAVVGRQPFGGFRLSGIGSKAGGPDYLLQFMEQRTITENLVRRGFNPE